MCAAAQSLCVARFESQAIAASCGRFSSFMCESLIFKCMRQTMGRNKNRNKHKNNYIHLLIMLRMTIECRKKEKYANDYKLFSACAFADKRFVPLRSFLHLFILFFILLAGLGKVWASWLVLSKLIINFRRVDSLLRKYEKKTCSMPRFNGLFYKKSVCHNWAIIFLPSNWWMLICILAQYEWMQQWRVSHA